MLCVVAPPGDHKYVPPPTDGVAVSVALCPLHTDKEFTATVGDAFTVTVPLPVLLHPFNEYVTVYVVVDAGLTVILAVVAPPGDHE